MKKTSLLVIFILLTSNVLFAQKIKMKKAELEMKLDSVLAEGNLLYKYERASWLAGDFAFNNPIIKAEYNGYFTYEDQGNIKTIILGDNFQSCIAEYVFSGNFDRPKISKLEKRELSEKEKKLIEIYNTILTEIVDSKYKVTYPPDDYNPNFILIPFAEKYKMYMIMGTVLENVIPFGNDFLFIADKNGEIESWRKFHSTFIPTYTSIGLYKVTGISHSHLETTPLMTATDICTFMLYAPLYNIDEFSVYSPALKKYMHYSLKNNSITVSKRHKSK